MRWKPWSRRSESGEETENSDDDDPISDLAPIGVL
jgi:hypothetical protein